MVLSGTPNIAHPASGALTAGLGMQADDAAPSRHSQSRQAVVFDEYTQVA
jgi:hypothetical protein